jgi:ankyrin repeat protein
MDLQAFNLFKAAERGDLEEVRRLVQRDRGLMDPRKFWSPLAAAASDGHIEVVRYLLDEGADMEQWSGRYGTALGGACSEGETQVVALLLARGARTTPSGGGMSPLMHAAQKGHTDIVELLLAHGEGEQLERRTSHQSRTALHLACLNRHAGVVRVLLGAGADPHVVDHNGDTPLSFAFTEGHTECVALLQVSIENGPLHTC